MIGQSHGFLWFWIRGIALQSAVMQLKHDAARCMMQRVMMAPPGPHCMPSGHGPACISRDSHGLVY